MQSCQVIHPETDIFDGEGNKISRVHAIPEGAAAANDEANSGNGSSEPLDCSGQLYVPLSAVRDLRAEEPDRVLTAPAVAELVHVTPGTVRRWVRQSELPCVLLDGTKRGYGIRASDVARFLLARAARSRS